MRSGSRRADHSPTRSGPEGSSRNEIRFGSFGSHQIACACPSKNITSRLMKYGAAFERLGYRLRVPRTEWTADSELGVCISLWRSQVNWKAASPRMDTRVDARSPELWAAHGAALRKQHLARAVRDFDGYVDVVIVDGVPGEGVTDAEPWNPKVRKGLVWRVTAFEVDSGHFVVETVSPAA